MPSPRTALAALTPSPGASHLVRRRPGADGKTELPFQRAPDGSPASAIAEQIGGSARGY
jgi:hypothetical protein